jgi:hypothetical protein
MTIDDDQRSGLPTVYSPFEVSEVEHDPRLPARVAVPFSAELGTSAARALLSVVGSAKGSAGSEAGDILYRLAVTDPALKQGLAEQTLRLATPSKGDASVLIKHVSDGRIAGRAELVRAGSASRGAAGAAGAGTGIVAVGAVALAAAMAMIIYQLKTINSKLDVIGGDLRRVLEHLELEQRSKLWELRDTSRAVLETLGAGGRVSHSLSAELSDELRSIRPVWRHLYQRAATDIANYRSGMTSVDHRSVTASWMQLLAATQVLAEAVQALTSLPRESEEELELLMAEQQQRLTERLDEVRLLAGELYAAHVYWREQQADYDLARTLNPVKLASRTVRASGRQKPRQQILNETDAWQCAQLAAPPPPPDAFLLKVSTDGRVAVAVEAHEFAMSA